MVECEHQAGEGAAHTRSRLPVELVYSIWAESIVQAFWFEKRVQNWSRAKREALIEGRLDLLPELAKKRSIADRLRCVVSILALVPRANSTTELWRVRVG